MVSDYHQEKLHCIFPKCCEHLNVSCTKGEEKRVGFCSVPYGIAN